MSRVLSDGSVAPKYFSPHGPIISAQNDNTLRMGRITDIYYPTDKGNLSGAFVEYDVLVDYADPMGNYSKVLYPRCKVVSKFGNGADFEFYTLRQSIIKPVQLNTLDTGSIVLLLCLNGDRRQSYIIGGIPTNFLTGNGNFQNLALSPGNNYVWQFNGAVINVNAAGEWSLTFNGATNNDGSLAPGVDSNASGSNISLTQDGNIALTSPNMLQQVQIDHANSALNITADESLSMFCSGQVTIQSAGVQIGAATDQMMLGSTYRQNEIIMNTEIAALTTTLMALLDTAGASITAAGAVCSTPPLTPLGAPLNAAGAALLAASAALQTWGTAIQTFETQSDTTPYISSKNFLD